MSSRTKICKQVERKDLPAFFRELADALENGGAEDLACIDDFRKFKIKGKAEFGQVMLSVAFKTKQECSSPFEACEIDGDRLEYTALKKRMKSSFRMIVNMIHEGQQPPKDAVKSFLDDSALMVTYSGYGDEYYTMYTEACDAFRGAYESGDIARMHETVDVLVHEKGRCHAKYA